MLVVSATRRRRDIELPLTVGPRTEKFNIIIIIFVKLGSNTNWLFSLKNKY